MVLLVLFVAVGAYLLVSRLGAAQLRSARGSTAALAMARDALIGRALADDNRPGSLPCPDTDDDGAVNGVAGNCTSSYLGRLPWKTMGLADLRDAAGERLWYVLSPALRDNEAAWPINGDTHATLTVDGADEIAAVVFAPGAALAGQNGRPGNAVADYLEGANADGDDAYRTGAPGEAFNDRLLVVRRSELMHAVASRIAGEALKCLHDFAAANSGRYPWAADVTASASGNYSDTDRTHFGRLPHGLDATSASLGITASWPAGCAIGSDSWDKNGWGQFVFYSLAPEFAPDAAPSPVCAGSCLAVANAAGGTDVRVVVIVAGEPLSGQHRVTAADRSGVANYLEGENATPADGRFERRAPGTAFNDVVVFE